MNKKVSNVEITAPVGSYESLAAAVRGGADSVYFGVGKLNMRSRSSANFQVEDLAKIAEKCRRLKLKSYLAMNTIIYDNELEEMKRYLAAAKEAGVSAIIASDIAVIQHARFLGLQVHMSVQANVCNIEAVKFYANFADVMVLARELTLPQIKEIIDAIHSIPILGPSGKPVRIEIFAHGALCVAVSGKCYMSLGCYDKSANRGACLQTCRRGYRVIDMQTDEELVLDNKYVMSPKDICIIPFIEQILDSGVAILKLEGRGRSSDYVQTVAKVYREAVDKWQQGAELSDSDKSNWMKELDQVFNRGFWEGGYYLGEKLGEWCGVEGNKSPMMKSKVGHITNYFSKLKVAEITLTEGQIKQGQTLLITGPTTGAMKTEIPEIRLAFKPVTQAVKGDVVSVQVAEKVRRNDIVYLIEKRPFGQNLDV